MKKSYLVIIVLIAAAVAAVLLFAPESGEQAQQPAAGQEGAPQAGALPEGHPDISAMQQEGAGGGMQQGDADGPNKSNVRKEFYEQLDALRKKVDANPKPSAADLRQLADLLVMSHRPQEAIPYYDRLAKADPKNIDVLLALASAHSQMKAYDKSLDVTKRILRIDPASTLAMYNLGAIHAQMGRKDDARKAWQKLIDGYPSSADAARANAALGKL